jgi:hypothetical protein
MEVGHQPHASSITSLGKGPGIESEGGWVGPRAGVDGYGEEENSWNFLTPVGFEPRTVQAIASGYTDYANPTP